jgi:hypothetical protein
LFARSTAGENPRRVRTGQRIALHDNAGSLCRRPRRVPWMQARGRLLFPLPAMVE